MSRKDRRKQQAIARRGGPDAAATGRVPRAGLVSELLLGNAGVGRAPSFEQVAGGIDPASLVQPADKIAHAFSAWASERELRAATERMEKLAAAQPGNPLFQFQLGNHYRDLKRLPEAIAAYRRCLDLDPANEHARHMLAALGGMAAPARADDRYVASLFDSFADSFDETLVHWLEYRGPEVVRDACVKALGAEPQGKLDIFDLGCGTGLAAPLLRPMARRLDGVDLSPGMLAKARERRLYDDLVEGEIVSCLKTRGRRYDLVVAPDVFVYFGLLDEAFPAVFDALRAGGLFVLTLERTRDDESDFVLRKTGRYAHNGAYLHRVAADSGFELLALTQPTVRMESKQPVPAWCLTLRRPSV